MQVVKTVVKIAKQKRKQKTVQAYARIQWAQEI